jgi:hypothetical protein
MTLLDRDSPVAEAPALPLVGALLSAEAPHAPFRAAHRRHHVTRRARKWLISGAMAGVVAACVMVLGAMALMRAAPQWWRTVLREDPATIKLATLVENSLISVATAEWPEAPAPDGGVRLSRPWTVEVNAAEVNAWLNVRLPLWLANQKDTFHWPRNMSDVQVDFAQDRITIGARVRAGERSQVLTATLSPVLDQEGRLYTPARWVNVGRLSIPASWVLDTAQGSAKSYIPPELLRLPETRQVFEAFEGSGPLVQHAVVKLGDGRRVRVLKVQPREGKLLVTCQTEG